MGNTFDFIIVGAGAAGCVTAEKLSRNSSCLLLEAGSNDSHPAIHQHDQWFTCATNPELTWALPTTLQAHLDSRQLNPNMGRVLGGSTSINAMYWVRGNLLDFDRWETVYNCSGWNGDRFLTAYKAIEITEDGDNRFHSRNGHIEVRQVPTNSAFYSFAEACKQVGVPFTADSNSDKQLGYSLVWNNVTRDFRRHSAFRAFVQPYIGRETLSLRTDSFVSRILFDQEQARGVECVASNGEKWTAHAQREVILSAGSFKTPQLLMLSGIGDADHLQSHGIDPLVNLPGVGLNFRDHLVTVLMFSAKKALPSTQEWSTWQVLGPANLDWKGNHRADFQLQWGVRQEFLTGFPKPPGHEDSDRVIVTAMALLHPNGKGSVRLASADPDAAPLINPNYLGDDADMVVWRIGLNLLRELMAAPGMNEWVEGEIGDHPDGMQLEDYVRKNCFSQWHPVGTCRMSSRADLLSVVDDRCRVRGLNALRVIDASVMPELPSGNTQAPTMAIAEIASSMVLEDHA
jgi:choline dehydrogenase